MPALKGPRVISDELRAAFEVYYAAGHTVKTTAEFFGIAKCRMYGLLKGKIIRGHARFKGSRVISQSLAEEIKACYMAGESLESTARHFGLAEKRVGRLMSGIVRHQGGRPSKVQRMADDIIRRWRSGEMQKSIARSLCISPTSVRSLLRRECSASDSTENLRMRYPGWVGGRFPADNGYTSVYLRAEHPMAEMCSPKSPHGGIVYEHRLVMAEYLGRPLKSHETVHHIDGNRSHNIIENLQLRIGNHGSGIAMRCLDCGSPNITPVHLVDAVSSSAGA